MNRAVSSREYILEICREAAAENGLDSLNMREIAGKCGISVGAVYNYFGSKGQLMMAAVDAIWSDIISEVPECPAEYPAGEYIEHIFYGLLRGSSRYPGFFSMHSASAGNVDPAEGRARMQRYFARITGDIVESVRNDSRVKKHIFNDEFTEKDFAGFIFENILAELAKGKESCRFLRMIAEKILY